LFERIDPRSPTPLYAQIAERLRVAIASGELGPGEPLPSVRQLAARLRVNPATAGRLGRLGIFDAHALVALEHLCKQAVTGCLVVRIAGIAKRHQAGQAPALIAPGVVELIGSRAGLRRKPDDSR
jgi:hypothetical protein